MKKSNAQKIIKVYPDLLILGCYSFTYNPKNGAIYRKKTQGGQWQVVDNIYNYQLKKIVVKLNYCIDDLENM